MVSVIKLSVTMLRVVAPSGGPNEVSLTGKDLIQFLLAVCRLGWNWLYKEKRTSLPPIVKMAAVKSFIV